MIDPLELDFRDIDNVLLDKLSKNFEFSPIQMTLISDTVKELDCSNIQAISRLAILSEDVITEALAEHIGWRYVSKVSDCPSVADIVAFISDSDLSLDWCVEQGLFAIRKDETSVDVFLSDLSNRFALSALCASFHSNDDIAFAILSQAMLANVVDDVSRERAVSELFGSAISNVAALAEEAPVINLVNSFLEKAVQTEASDVHIEAGSKNMLVRFRIDGTLVEYMQQPISRFPAIASRIKLIADLDIAERRLPQDGRFSTRQAGQEFDVRVSTAPDVHGESIVMRLLPKKREQLSLSKLGFEPDHLDTIRRWGKLSNGIVLVTGPTGSGKSTTLYGLLQDVKTGAEKIVTVEDPVEFQVEGVTQVQAKPEIGYTFAKALRTFLRQDPDVIMVGEIRDKETADIAVQSSLTGHLVLSTLHTNDACSVFPRLADMGVEPFLIAATIQGVQAQRLVRKLCVHCAVKTEQPAYIKENFTIMDGLWKNAVGCPKCQGRGYKGRVGIYELVEVSSSLRTLITKGASLAELRKQAKLDGARSLFADGILKASTGITSVEEILRVCSTEGVEQ
ncbi:GspE/PulE family protein [Agaribacter marinus]|uniref:Type II secretion protein n=1 Tax=Agaribacter marinus TaxID=1431249 RepID=A0AA37WH74_9ALTE|nr:GspE/PulE family protein [Agaribacter marinus]GLR70876.1 type II secretion protein [Agaribacter marinus]